MNDSMTAHRFKNKEPERRSTRSRTDEPLDLDKASHPRSGRRRRDPPSAGSESPPYPRQRQLGQHVVLPLPRDSGYTLAIMPRPR